MAFSDDVFAAFNNTHLNGQKVFSAGGGIAEQPMQQAQPEPEMQGGYAYGGGNSYQQNPYLTQMGDAMTQQVTSNLTRNIMPQIRSQAQSVGGFGGSRQGVVEANAMNDANQGLSNALANLYGADWTNSQNRGLQRYGMDQNYNLGMGNLGLNAQNSQQNFYTSQRGQDLQAVGLGAQLVGSGNTDYLNAGSGVSNLGTSAQQAPWQTTGQYTQTLSPFTGFGATTTTGQNSNPWAQALGGAIAGGQIGKLF